jgi:hypothetical protein
MGEEQVKVKFVKSGQETNDIWCLLISQSLHWGESHGKFTFIF